MKLSKLFGKPPKHQKQIPNEKFKSSDKFLELAVSSFKDKDYALASEMVDKALQVYLDNVGAWQLKGEILVKQGDKQGAYTWFKKVVNLAPEWQTKSWLGISKLLLEDKNYEAARDVSHYGLIVYDSPLYQNTKNLKDIMLVEPNVKTEEDEDQNIKEELLKIYEEASKKSTN